MSGLDAEKGILEYATGQMLAQEPHPSGDRGWIVNLTSVHGFVGTAAGTSSYVASKGAIVTLTKALALEYGKDKMLVSPVLIIARKHN